MKNILMFGYLVCLSVQDIYQKKISLWLLLLAIVSGVGYAFIQQRGWGIFLDVLPGGILCLIALAAPKTVGIGDGLVGIIYGLFYGGLSTCICFMMTFILVAVVGVIWCIGKRGKKLQIPFLPFLTVIYVGIHL